MSKRILRCEYVGGVLPHERPLCEKFEYELLPYLEKMGAYIGELAMMGHKPSEEIILRHNGFLKGGPDARQYNFNRLVRAMRTFRHDWEETKQSYSTPSVH